MDQLRVRDRCPNSIQNSILPLLPLRDIVVFPRMVVPLFVGREKSIRALEFAMDQEKKLVLVAQRDARVVDPSDHDIYRVGVIGSVAQLLKLPDGTLKTLVEGKDRVEILRFVDGHDFLRAEVVPILTNQSSSLEVEALFRTANAAFESYVRLNPKIPSGILETVFQVRDLGMLADYLVGYFNFKLERRQKLLEIVSPSERLERLVGFMEGEIEILRVEKKDKVPDQETGGKDQEGVLSK